MVRVIFIVMANHIWHAGQGSCLGRMILDLLSGTLHVDGLQPPHLEWPGHPVFTPQHDRTGYLAVRYRDDPRLFMWDLSSPVHILEKNICRFVSRAHTFMKTLMMHFATGPTHENAGGIIIGNRGDRFMEK